jgi:hypothetical protein
MWAFFILSFQVNGGLCPCRKIDTFFLYVAHNVFLPFQAMVIIAWSPSGSLSSIFEADVFRNVLTIFITAAFLNFLQGKTLLCDSAAVFYLLSNILHFLSRSS